MAESKEALLKQQCEKYMQRVCMYIDGANFYYSFYETRTDIVLGWCDFRKLAENYLIDPNSKLESINYFYAPVEDLAHSSDEERRQNTWLDAICIYSKVKSYKGFYSGKKPTDRKEKQTDVNIAIRMLLDAFDDKYDNAILVSGDTDLAPAVLAV